MHAKIATHMQNGFLLAVIAAFCGGATPVAAKIALEVFHPFTVITLRFFFAALFLFPFVYRNKEASVRLLKSLSGVAVIGALNPILLFIALPLTKASVSPLIYACVPALTALFLYITQKKTITTPQAFGIAVGFIGVALIILLPVVQKGNNLAAFSGNLLIFCAAIAFMLYGIVSKKKQAQLNVSPLALTFYFSIITLLISIPFTVREILTYGLSASILPIHILSGIFIGVIGTGLFYITYQYALKISSELAANLFTYLQPIATISLASLFLGERITLPFVIGGVLAVVGARIASRK